jgi:mRNA interferase MazF
LVAPMTTTLPQISHSAVSFQGKTGQVALDQIRAVDRERLIRKLGTISAKPAQQSSDVLLEIFAR